MLSIHHSTNGKDRHKSTTYIHVRFWVHKPDNSKFRYSVVHGINGTLRVRHISPLVESCDGLALQPPPPGALHNHRWLQIQAWDIRLFVRAVGVQQLTQERHGPVANCAGVADVLVGRERRALSRSSLGVARGESGLVTRQL